MSLSPSAARAFVVAGVAFAALSAGCGPRHEDGAGGGSGGAGGDERWRVEPRPDAASLGPRDAPVSLVLFLDLEDERSGEALRAARRVLEAEPRRARLAVLHLPLPHHARARRLALGAECAREEGRAFAFLDLAFAEAAPEPDDLARELGLDPERFRSCLASGRPERALDLDRALAESAGARAVPVLYANGLKLAGGLPGRELLALVGREAEAPVASPLLEVDPLAAAPIEVDLGAAEVLGPEGAPLLVLVADPEVPDENAIAAALLRLAGEGEVRAAVLPPGAATRAAGITRTPSLLVGGRLYDGSLGYGPRALRRLARRAARLEP